MSKGSTSTSATTSNEPPTWARQALTTAGNESTRLYNEGSGYHTYTGPTQAPLSDATLGGYNALLSATGSKAAPVTNASLQSIIDEIKARMPSHAEKKAASVAARGASTGSGGNSAASSNQLWPSSYYYSNNTNDGRL